MYAQPANNNNNAISIAPIATFVLKRDGFCSVVFFSSFGFDLKIAPIASFSFSVAVFSFILYCLIYWYFFFVSNLYILFVIIIFLSMAMFSPYFLIVAMQQ